MYMDLKPPEKLVKAKQEKENSANDWQMAYENSEPDRTYRSYKSGIKNPFLFTWFMRKTWVFVPQLRNSKSSEYGANLEEEGWPSCRWRNGNEKARNWQKRCEVICFLQKSTKVFWSSWLMINRLQHWMEWWKTLQPISPVHKLRNQHFMDSLQRSTVWS